MNYHKLRVRILEIYGHKAGYSRFAEAMGLNRPTLSGKLKPNGIWTQAQILKACELLDIPRCEIDLYFFAPEVA